MEIQQSANWKVEASEHDARGFVTCTASGAIVWRGPIAEFSARDNPAFDMVFCHDHDAARVLQALERTRRSPG